MVKLKTGARILVPKATPFNREVAAQLPTGWNALRYGISDDIINQVDRVSLWALVCAAEALIMSGITDPYELYQHIHPSEIGSSIGSAMGGLLHLKNVFVGRKMEQDVARDSFQ